ncbi:hypothetical protein MRX96_052927 [Rhipicephalus microplus]
MSMRSRPSITTLHATCPAPGLRVRLSYRRRCRLTGSIGFVIRRACERRRRETVHGYDANPGGEVACAWLRGSALLFPCMIRLAASKITPAGHLGGEKERKRS